MDGLREAGRRRCFPDFVWLATLVLISTMGGQFVVHLQQEADALIGHVRIRAGGAQ
jgi:hypothetical protein